MTANPYYQMETPTLGDIDFITKPNGAYKVDIYDVVTSASTYSSSGTSIPDAKWLPGADLTSTGDKEDIYDIVTITSIGSSTLDLPMMLVIRGCKKHIHSKGRL